MYVCVRVHVSHISSSFIQIVLVLCSLMVVSLVGETIDQSQLCRWMKKIRHYNNKTNTGVLMSLGQDWFYHPYQSRAPSELTVEKSCQIKIKTAPVSWFDWNCIHSWHAVNAAVFIVLSDYSEWLRVPAEAFPLWVHCCWPFHHVPRHLHEITM